MAWSSWRPSLSPNAPPVIIGSRSFPPLLFRGWGSHLVWPQPGLLPCLMQFPAPVMNPASSAPPLTFTILLNASSPISAPSGRVEAPSSLVRDHVADHCEVVP